MAKRKPKKLAAKPESTQVKAQRAVFADLVVTAKHYLGELNKPFVIVIDGHPDLISNMSVNVARGLLQSANDFQIKLIEAEDEEKVKKLIEYPPRDD